MDKLPATVPRYLKHLNPNVHRIGEMAHARNMYLAHFHSGSTRNESNGFRLFWGREPRDFFAGGHLIHLRTSRLIEVFLDGWRAALQQDQRSRIDNPP